MDRESSSGTPVSAGFKKSIPPGWFDCMSGYDTDKRSDDGNLLTVLIEWVTVLLSELALEVDKYRRSASFLRAFASSANLDILLIRLIGDLLLRLVCGTNVYLWSTSLYRSLNLSI